MESLHAAGGVAEGTGRGGRFTTSLVRHPRPASWRQTPLQHKRFTDPVHQATRAREGARCRAQPQKEPAGSGSSGGNFQQASSAERRQALLKYVNEVDPKLVETFVAQAPPHVVEAMKQTISNMVGTLPPQFFSVTVSTVGENLVQLMFSVVMTGYMFRNAQYRLELANSLGGAAAGAALTSRAASAGAAAAAAAAANATAAALLSSPINDASYAPGVQKTQVSGDVLRWHNERGVERMPAVQYIDLLEKEVATLKQMLSQQEAGAAPLPGAGTGSSGAGGGAAAAAGNPGATRPQLPAPGSGAGTANGSTSSAGSSGSRSQTPAPLAKSTPASMQQKGGASKQGGTGGGRSWWSPAPGTPSPFNAASYAAAGCGGSGSGSNGSPCGAAAGSANQLLEYLRGLQAPGLQELTAAANKDVVDAMDAFVHRLMGTSERERLFGLTCEFTATELSKVLFWLVVVGYTLRSQEVRWEMDQWSV